MFRRRVAFGPALSRPIHWDVVPKPGGGLRRLTMLTAADDVAFARSVAGAVPAIRMALGVESQAHRVVGWDPGRGPVLEPWRRARTRWLREVRRLGVVARYVAVTDVRACYPSIAPGTIAERLRVLGAPEESVLEVESWLRLFRDAGVDGLPVGPAISHLLADAVLSAGDDAIRATGAAHVRWVDDVVIFARSPQRRAVALEALRRTWASFGLELHHEKTLLFNDREGLDSPLGAASNSRLRAPRCDNRAT